MIVLLFSVTKDVFISKLYNIPSLLELILERRQILISITDMVKSGRLTCEKEKDWRLTERKWNSLWRQGNWKISCPVLSVNWDIKVPREMCSWCSCGEGKKTGLTRSSTEWMVKRTGTHPEFCSLVLVGHSKVDWTPNAEIADHLWQHFAYILEYPNMEKLIVL